MQTSINGKTSLILKLFSNKEYAEQFIARMNDRISFVKSRETEKAGLDKLPADALEALEAVVKEASLIKA